MTDLPSPPVPPDLDMRSLEYMPLVVTTLRNSTTARKASGDEFRAAVLLWCAAWYEIPASSLPDDDTELSSIAGYGRGGEEAWAAIRAGALRGFVKCNDGRLYHPFIAARALKTAEVMQKNRNRTAPATAARIARRNAQRNENETGERSEQPPEPPRPIYNVRNEASPGNVTDTKGIEENRIEGKSEPSHSPAPVPREAGSGLDWDVIEARLRAAADWQNESAPGLCVVGPVIALIEAGASLELDVLPTVRALAPKCRTRTGWKYFLEAIKEARDLRLSMAGPSAHQGAQKPANGAMSEAEAAAFLESHTAKIKSGARP